MFISYLIDLGIFLFLSLLGWTLVQFIFGKVVANLGKYTLSLPVSQLMEGDTKVTLPPGTMIIYIPEGVFEDYSKLRREAYACVNSPCVCSVLFQNIDDLNFKASMEFLQIDFSLDPSLFQKKEFSQDIKKVMGGNAVLFYTEVNEGNIEDIRENIGKLLNINNKIYCKPANRNLSLCVNDVCNEYLFFIENEEEYKNVNIFLQYYYTTKDYAILRVMTD